RTFGSARARAAKSRSSRWLAKRRSTSSRWNGRATASASAPCSVSATSITRRSPAGRSRRTSPACSMRSTTRVRPLLLKRIAAARSPIRRRPPSASSRTSSSADAASKKERQITSRSRGGLDSESSVCKSLHRNCCRENLMQRSTTSGGEMMIVQSEPAAAVGPARILELGFGFWASKTLLSAVELGVFTELALAPADAATLRQRLGLHERAAVDFLDALVALGLLERQDGAYRNAPEADLFLDREKPSYVGGILEMANARLYPFWGRLTEALRPGEPQNEARTGDDFFAALYADPQRLGQFLHAMTGLSMGASRAIARAFPFERYASVADVGCAEGGLLVEIARVHEHLAGIGFDLPVVESHFRHYVESQGLGDRMRFEPGDFFADELPRADVL